MISNLSMPLFPLKTVLFNRGLLPLNIFEPRYLRMVHSCIENDTGFGVVLIQSGSEVYSNEEVKPPDVSRICTLASVIDHEEQENQLSVLLEGGAKVQIDSTWEEADHLMMAEVTFLPDEPPMTMTKHDREIYDFLRQIIDPTDVVAEGIFDFDDARDISLFYSQYLPMPVDFKQKLLQLDDGRSRMIELFSVISIQS